jgi:hypothetical protein
MIKIITVCSVLFFFLMLVACDSPASENNENQEKLEEEIQEKTTATKESPTPEKLETLDFEGKVTTDKGQESIVKIDIYQKGERTIFQTLEGLELPYQVDNPFFDAPTFEDLNFDGIPDLRMPNSLGNANVYYAYWIYNPATKKFEQNTEMNLSLPKVDAAKKQIMSFERNSAASYVETIYEYKDGEFITARIENKDYTDENKYQSVVQERQTDGSMKEVRNELIEK